MKKISQKQPSNVNLQFKLLSVIGIIIIVAGHCYSGGFSLAYEWFPIYSFQLTMFAFISGYFYKQKNEDGVLSYIWKRFTRLVIPAYLWNIAYGLFALLLTYCGYTFLPKVNLYNLFVMPFIDGEALKFNLGSWFVYPLFCVCVINVLFRKLLKALKISNEYLIMTVYLAVGMVSVWACIEHPQVKDGAMLLVFRTLFFLPGFGMGYFYKEKLENHDKMSNTAYFTILFSVQLMLIQFCKDLAYTPSGCSGYKNGFVIPYITSITGIAFWLRVTKILTPTIKNWKLVRLIGDNTYSIMIHHFLGFMCVKWIFCLMSMAGSVFSDFNVESLKSAFWYYYLPNGKTQFAVVYVLAGIFIPILIKHICDLCAKGVKRVFVKNKETGKTAVKLQKRKKELVSVK